MSSDVGFVEEVVEAPPYPSAKPYFLIEDQLENKEWVSTLVRLSVKELPPPKPKKKNLFNAKSPSSQRKFLAILCALRAFAINSFCGGDDFFERNFVSLGQRGAIIVFWRDGADLSVHGADFDANGAPRRFNGLFAAISNRSIDRIITDSDGRGFFENNRFQLLLERN